MQRAQILPPQYSPSVLAGEVRVDKAEEKATRGIIMLKERLVVQDVLSGLFEIDTRLLIDIIVSP
jgi:hypothetical protein